MYKRIIMKKIILIISILSYLGAHSQEVIKKDTIQLDSIQLKPSVRDTVILTPETLYTKDNRSLRIVTFNPAVEVLIVKHFANSQMTLWANKKRDRLGEYVLYTIHLPLTEERRLLSLFNK